MTDLDVRYQTVRRHRELSVQRLERFLPCYPHGTRKSSLRLPALLSLDRVKIGEIHQRVYAPYRFFYPFESPRITPRRVIR